MMLATPIKPYSMYDGPILEKKMPKKLISCEEKTFRTTSFFCRLYGMLLLGKMASMEEKPGMQEINLMSLAIPQLNQLKNQLDQELGVFQESLETLKIAQNKLSESEESLKKITKDSLGAEILVPLSASMYVPGRISDAEHTVIDIGTGYYVQKDVIGGIDYFRRKVDFVTEQMEKIQAMGLEKSKVRDAIVEVMEIKLQAHLQSSKPANES